MDYRTKSGSEKWRRKYYLLSPPPPCVSEKIEVGVNGPGTKIRHLSVLPLSSFHVYSVVKGNTTILFTVSLRYMDRRVTVSLLVTWYSSWTDGLFLTFYLYRSGSTGSTQLTRHHRPLVVTSQDRKTCRTIRRPGSRIILLMTQGRLWSWGRVTYGSW